MFVIVSNLSNAQRRNKRTSKREIRKRQEEANKKSQYNKFNELQPMGQKSSQARIDYIWSYETANTVPLYSGDISIITPSRFSRRKGVEFGTSFLGLPVIPSFYLKKKWTEGKVYFATRHQVYSYSPMLYLAQEMDYLSIFPSQAKLPVTIALKNEFIFSRPFLKSIKCGSVKQPYIIITGAVGYDYGFQVEETDVDLMQRKILKQRSGVILGNDGFLSLRLQGDFYIMQNLYATVAVRGLYSGKDIGNSIEQNSFVRFQITPRFTLSGGYWVTFGEGTGSSIIPLVDLTYHFGNKQGRAKGLFGK